MGRGLSRKQQRILEIIDDAEHVRVRELRNRIAGSAQALSRSITRLVERGFLERVSIMEGKRAMPAVRKKLNR
jgi:DNA-binding MarR family transcriptional regulator